MREKKNSARKRIFSNVKGARRAKKEWEKCHKSIMVANTLTDRESSTRSGKIRCMRSREYEKTFGQHSFYSFTKHCAKDA